MKEHLTEHRKLLGISQKGHSKYSSILTIIIFIILLIYKLIELWNMQMNLDDIYESW